MNEETYQKRVKGHIIRFADITADGRIIFSLKEVNSNKGGKDGLERHGKMVNSRVLVYDIERYKERKFGQMGWSKGINNLYVALIPDQYAREAFIFCEDDFDVWENSTEFQRIPGATRNNHARGAFAIKHISGSIYVVGMTRKIYKRISSGNWQDMTDESLLIDLKQYIDNGMHIPTWEQTTFFAIDGFTENNLYVGGERGVCFHYNGKHWNPIDLPINMDIRDITCAEDGHVYITGRFGGVIKGKNDSWKHIDGDSFSSSAWFNKKLYLANENNLYTLDDDIINAYTFPENGVQAYDFGKVVSCETALLAYSGYQALVFDGIKWKEIVGSPALDQSK